MSQRELSFHEALAAVFADLDELGAEHGAVAQLFLRDGGQIWLRVGPGTNGWPAKPPFTNYEVSTERPLAGLWRRYEGPRLGHRLTYVTVPRLLITDLVVAGGGLKEAITDRRYRGVVARLRSLR